MGNILSFFRKKKSSLEELQEVDDVIKTIEEYNRNVERRHQKVKSILYYVGFLLIVVGSLYMYFAPPRSFRDSCVLGAILLVISIMLVFLQQITCWYYNMKIKSNKKMINDSKNKKDEIIKKVMDKETYNVAKSILEKYAPATALPRTAMVPINKGIDLRHRSVQPFAREVRARPSESENRNLVNPVSTITVPGRWSFIDRFAEFVVGEGTTNRFALICSRCHSHNGLALPEEFPYIAFRCFNCQHNNPARKHRPTAPRLESLSDFDDSSQNTERSTNQNSMLLDSGSNVANATPNLLSSAVSTSSGGEDMTVTENVLSSNSSAVSLENKVADLTPGVIIASSELTNETAPLLLQDSIVLQAQAMPFNTECNKEQTTLNHETLASCEDAEATAFATATSYGD